MKKTRQKFTIRIPVKPYVKRFLEINYAFPIEFTANPADHRVFQGLLHKPGTHRDKRIGEQLLLYTEEVEVLISEHDFYRYGWELTRTNTVAFGKYFEKRAKTMMRSIIGIHVSLGMPINKSIEKFQERYRFDEDIWKYEAIKKDFFRNGRLERVDFEDEIFQKIEKIILHNLYDLGTIGKQVIKVYEAV